MAMSATGSGGEEEVLSDINVTPLVDVMLVLLIIFIITVPVALKEIKVNLPKASNLPTQTKPEDVTIAVDKSGAIYWNTKLLPNQDALLAELRAAAQIQPQPEVHIRGDSDSRYMYVGQVLVAAQKIGIRKVAFLTSPLHPGETP
ncbi:MAG TPA: biopolymer transporter ExbD [Steroidobacteraceae bacterium]|nr:biopolymer transporter ExbD [Steroidobacteraceae bacterium]